MNNDIPPSAHRIDWIDYAKGMCIIWVVTLYSNDFVKEITHATSWMDAVVDFGRPFRMPDFFLLSGLFVSRTLNRSLRDYIDSKVLYFFYFYALWVTLKFINLEWASFHVTGLGALLLTYLRMYMEPPTGPLWFIYILALFFIAARLLRSVPPALVIVGAALLECAQFESNVKLFNEFTQFFVFFYCGHIFSRYILQLAAWTRANHAQAALLFTVWFVVNAVFVYRGFHLRPGMPLILGFAGAIAVIILATQLDGVPGLSWLRYLGKNSIVVYLGFVIPVGLMRRLVASYTLIAEQGILSLTVTAAAIFGALLLYWAVRATPARFLFVRPAWMSIKRTSISARETPLRHHLSSVK